MGKTFLQKIYIPLPYRVLGFLVIGLSLGFAFPKNEIIHALYVSGTYFPKDVYKRQVHKGDLTGIEIVSRITEQVIKRKIPVLEECRAVDLLLDEAGTTVTLSLIHI